jgi:hypothetical protein
MPEPLDLDREPRAYNQPSIQIPYCIFGPFQVGRFADDTQLICSVRGFSFRYLHQTDVTILLADLAK